MSFSFDTNRNFVSLMYGGRSIASVKKTHALTPAMKEFVKNFDEYRYPDITEPEVLANHLAFKQWHEDQKLLEMLSLSNENSSTTMTGLAEAIKKWEMEKLPTWQDASIVPKDFTLNVH